MKEYFNNLYKGNLNDLLIEIDNTLRHSKKKFIITANPETYMFASKSREFKKMILNKNHIVVADGIGIIIGSKIIKQRNINKIPGVEIAKNILEIGDNNKNSIVLFGSSEDVINLLVKKINNEYSNLNVLGYSNGYLENKDKEFEKLLSLKPDIIMVALGIPHQELLINKYYDKMDKGLFIGVGGSFDVISGFKKRAPIVFQKLNLEWLYRIIKEPKRIKRFYNNNIKFMFKLIRKK